MSMPTDNAITWRELADQLTDRQRAAIEQIEQAFAATGHVNTAEAAETLLGYAREHIEERLADAAYCDIPVPGGASSGRWEHNTAGGWSRSLLWRTFGDSNMTVDIDGRQEHDGSYTCLISVYRAEDGASLTSVGARKLAGLLVEAAEHLDRLA